MPRRTVTATALASVALLAGGVAGPSASAVTAPGNSTSPGPGSAAPAKTDTLHFTVENSGDPSVDGAYGLKCNPSDGDHPDAAAACDTLEALSAGERDPFKPVGPDESCSMIYGGPTTAHVVGTWHGREVDARFKRSNGCEIDRWDAIVPALPKV